MKIKYYIFLLFSFFSLSVISQYNNPVHYTIDNGLPSSEVYQIIQTQDGYIWFATDRGICQYNGYEFESFNVKDGLPNNTVFGFYPTENGTIWCTTLGNKLFSFDLDLNFQAYPYNQLISETIKNGVIADLFFYRGELFISFHDLIGYLKVSKDGVLLNNTLRYKNEKRLVYEEVQNNGFAYTLRQDTAFKAIFEDSKVIIHETNNGNAINILALKENTIVADHQDVYIYKNGDPNPLQLGNSALGIGKLDQDRFWVGYNFGGFKIYKNNGELIFAGLAEESVTSLFLDHEKGIWVSTRNSGVYYYRFNEIYSLKLDEGLSNSVTDITTNDSDQVYVAYNDGNVIELKNRNYSLLYQAKQSNEAKLQFYKALGDVIVNSDNIQFLVSKPDSAFFQLRGILNYDDNSMHPIAHGSYSSICIGLDKAKEIEMSIRVNDLVPYQDGYCLASNFGVFYYNIKRDTMSQLNPFCNYRFEDVDLVNGTYYAGSMGYGVFIYRGDSLLSVDKQDGLYSNMISQITVENDSVIWVCTNRGLNRVWLKSDGTKRISGVTQIDGLLSNETVDVAVANDTVWVGTKLGMCYFSKRLLEVNKKEIPDYYLTLEKIKINENEIESKALKSLDYTQNNITFFFNAISYNHNSKLRYEYKLEGLDNQWHSTTQLNIRYPAIPAGSYTFYLKVFNKTLPNDFNRISIPITIYPPFYNSWWFYVLLFSFVVGLIYLFFKLYILTYNKDIVRELLRVLLKRIKAKDKYVVLRMDGQDIRIPSSDITYVKAAGNYLDVNTINEKHIIRCKISEFLSMVPDPIEFVQVHRSFIVRIDRIKKKDSKTISIADIEISITKTFKEAIGKIQF